MLLDKLNADVVCLVETKLANHLNSKVFDLGNYNVFRKDRINQAALGGSMVVLVNKKLVTSTNNVYFLNNYTYKKSVYIKLFCRIGVH